MKKKEGIKEKTLIGFFWKFSERILSQFISLVISVILARILLPADYTVVSVITIFFSFANIFVIGGLSAALIQKKDADEIDYSAVLYVTLFLSLLIYGLLFFLAPSIAGLFEQPILTSMIRVMGLTLPVSAVQSVWTAYISSSLKFKKFFFSTLGGTLFSGVVGLYMAVVGYGSWALVAQQMSSIAINTLILIFTTPIKFVLKFSFDRFKILWKFGWKVFVSSLISATYSETTPLIIGLKFNDVDLAYYTKGRNFPGLISNTMTNSLSSVLFSVFSKKQDDKPFLLESLRKYIRIASFAIFPLMLGFLMVSDTFVLVVLTEKWIDAAPYIKIFCLAYMFDMLSVGNCEVIKAMGRSDTFLIIEIIKKSLYFIVITIFVFTMKSSIMLAVSSILCSLIAVIINSLPNKKLLNYKYSMQLIDIMPNLFNSAVMCVVVGLVGMLDINNTLLLILQIVSGATAYLIMCAITKNKSYEYACGFLKNLLKKS